MSRMKEFWAKPTPVKAVRYLKLDAETLVDYTLNSFFGHKPQEISDEEGAQYRTGRLVIENEGMRPQYAEPGQWLVQDVHGVWRVYSNKAFQTWFHEGTPV